MSLNKLLDRVQSRVDPVVYSNIMQSLSAPLMVAPDMIDGYIKGFLIGAGHNQVAVGDEFDSVPSYIIPEIETGVIEITGALTSRDIIVPCAASPASYEAIRHKMQVLIDQDMKFIVARINSGGGMASQMADLSRWIASQRDNVRLIAVVDDHAYSAAYGIASAFDTIYVSETSGALSIGTVLRHSFIKEENEHVTYIVSGNKKIDGASDKPLTDSAFFDMQLEVNRLGRLFRGLVSANLGMELNKVTDTQAGTLHGEAIVREGFAHGVMTFADVIQAIFDGDLMTKEELEAARGRVAVQQAKLDRANDILNEKEEALNAELLKDVSGDTDVVAKAEAVKDKVDADGRDKIDADVKAKADAAKIDAEVKAEKAKADALIEAQAKADIASVDAELRAKRITSMCQAGGVSAEVEKMFISSDSPVDKIANMIAEMSSSNQNDDIDSNFSFKPKMSDSDKKAKLAKSWDKAFNCK